jgi:hypothetical protein
LDASGLTGGDRFTFGVAHTGIVDLLRGWRRAAVPQVCDEISSLCRAYRIQKVICDQYSFPFLAELMRVRGVALAEQPFSARSKPEVFFSLKTALAGGQLQLPDHPEMLRELRALESVRTSSGNYKIGAPKGMHDDFVTTLALLALKLASCSKPYTPQIEVFSIRNARPSREVGINWSEETRRREEAEKRRLERLDRDVGWIRIS